jgi:hypothetical protein
MELILWAMHIGLRFWIGRTNDGRRLHISFTLRESGQLIRGWPQLVDATVSRSLSAGVLKPRVSLGR